MNKNNTIIIIGAGSSVGKVLCDDLHAQGATIHAVFHSDEKYNAFIHKNAVKYKLDLGNNDEVRGFVKTIAGSLKAFSGLVFCSGTDISAPLKLIPSKMLEDAFRINLFSVIEISKALLFSRKIYADGASIVYLASVAARRGYYGKTVYSAYKGALAGFAQSLAKEVSIRKIRVNTVSPGTFHSAMSHKVFSMMDQQQLAEFESMHPLGLGNPSDVAAAVKFLLSDSGKWITGIDMVVDGGYTLK